MTKRKLLNILQPLSDEEQIHWMIDLGGELTVAARGGYPVEEQPGSITHLIAFNEMQHQLYGRIRTLRRKEEWTLESFLNGLVESAVHYKVEGDFGWALKRSVSRLT